MNNIEQYEFDRQGFLVLKDFLTSQEVTTLAPIINKLVNHPKTMSYITKIVQGEIGINNS